MSQQRRIVVKALLFDQLQPLLVSLVARLGPKTFAVCQQNLVRKSVAIGWASLSQATFFALFKSPGLVQNVPCWIRREQANIFIAASRCLPESAAGRFLS